MLRIDQEWQGAVGRSLESANSEESMYAIIEEHLLIKHPIYTHRMEVLGNSPGQDHSPSFFIKQQLVNAELAKLGEASMEALVLQQYINQTCNSEKLKKIRGISI